MKSTPTLNPALSTPLNSLEQLKTLGLWQPGAPLRLHLGCGETHLAGYLNLDYPPTEHNVMAIKADVYADILALDFPDGSVDEIRLEHVFEHFSRVTALALLIRWQQWLKVGGRLHLVTPDLVGSAKNIAGSEDFLIKMGSVRHLAGDQAASWAYHVDHWFEERFQHTLSHLGFSPVHTSCTHWDKPPFLWNVQALATKAQHLPVDELLRRCDELLWQSTVSPAEKPTYDVWCKQLREVLKGAPPTKPANVTPLYLEAVVKAASNAQRPATELTLGEIHDFNQLGRDQWVISKAASVPAGARVLDVGAGTCPYKRFFSQCEYRTHDFKQYEGEKLGGTTEYGQIDYVSDIKAIPVPDSSFDIILCTEVLEHVPEPIEALREMARIIKPGGRIFMTAPLGSGLHQKPFHFYGGYTPYWYQKFCAQFALEIVELKGNRGFFAHLSQMCVRASSMLAKDPNFPAEVALSLQDFFGSVLPSFFFSLDSQSYLEDFTVGYFVEARKPLR